MCASSQVPGADSEEKREPAGDIDTAVVDSLKVLDLKRPIGEAEIGIADYGRRWPGGAFKAFSMRSSRSRISFSPSAIKAIEAPMLTM